MAQQVKMPPAKPDDRSSIPGTWQKEKADSQRLSSECHTKHRDTCAPMLTHAHMTIDTHNVTEPFPAS